jgi:HEAT repeat protein
MSKRDIWAAVVAVWCASAAHVAAQDDVVRDLANRLKGSDVEAKLQAIDMLSDLGAAARAAVPALSNATSDKDPKVRSHAARALGAIGPAAAAAVPVLAARLKDDDGLVRAHAVRSLGLIGQGNKNVDSKTIQQVGALIADPDERVRRTVVQTFIRIRPDRSITIPLFTKILEESEPSVKLLVLNAMAEAGADAVPVLLEALDRPESRYWGCLILSEIGPPAEAAVPKLLQIAQDKAAEVRMEALMALGAIKPKDAKAIAGITAALKDPVGGVRYAAAYALGNIGPLVAKQAGAQLKKMAFTPGDEFLRTTSLWAVIRIFPDDKALLDRAAPMLVSSVRHSDPRVRAAAARALADVTTKPDVTIPALIGALGDEQMPVVASAIDGLVAQGAKVVEPASRALKSAKLRPAAIVVLKRLGPAAKDSVPALVQAMNAEPKLEVRREIFFALAAIGPGSEEAVPLLIPNLTHENVKVRNGASYALGKIGPKAKSALPTLRKNMSSRDDPFLPLISAWALAQIDYENAETVELTLPLFIKALEHQEVLVRVEAANSLALFGPRAKEAVPALKKAADDRDRHVREAAAAALKKIEG